MARDRLLCRCVFDEAMNTNCDDLQHNKNRKESNRDLYISGHLDASLKMFVHEPVAAHSIIDIKVDAF